MKTRGYLESKHLPELRSCVLLKVKFRKQYIRHCINLGTLGASVQKAMMCLRIYDFKPHTKGFAVNLDSHHQVCLKSKYYID